MANSSQETVGCQPARYQIKISGVIREDWSNWLNGMAIAALEAGIGTWVTTLDGYVPDQAALRGILCKLWDLNLTILSVLRMDAQVEKKVSE